MFLWSLHPVNENDYTESYTLKERQTRVCLQQPMFQIENVTQDRDWILKFAEKKSFFFFSQVDDGWLFLDWNLFSSVCRASHLYSGLFLNTYDGHDTPQESIFVALHFFHATAAMLLAFSLLLCESAGILLLSITKSHQSTSNRCWLIFIGGWGVCW
jgi:hypothetical protein